MKAARIHEQGPDARLTIDEVPAPTAGPNEVLISVEAAGVNFADLMIRVGAYPLPIELPYTLGTEVVGTIVETGAGVDPARIGTRVTAMLPSGGYAELAIAAAEAAAPTGTDTDPAISLALQVQGITAYQLLTEAASLHPGATVLVHAAAGGVGSLAVQIARHLGAGVVIGTTGSDAKRDAIVQLGADIAVNTADPAWPELVEATAGPIDIALDSIGGAVTSATLDLLRVPTGRLVVFGASSGQLAQLDVGRLIAPNLTVTGYSMYPYLGDPVKMKAASTALDEMSRGGAVRVIAEHRFSLRDADQAQELLRSRRSIGKIVILP